MKKQQNISSQTRTLLKIISVFIAFGLWVWIQLNENGSTTLKMAVQYNLPESLLEVNELPKNVLVEVNGAKGRIKQLQNTVLETTIDVSDGIEGTNSIEMMGHQIHEIPEGIKITRITPPILEIILNKPMQREVQIKANILGSPASNWKISDIQIDPKTLIIEGPEQIVEKLTEVNTKIIDISQLDTDSDFRSTVIFPSKIHSITPNTIVDVHVHIIPEKITRAYTESIVISNSLDVDIQPKTVSVLLSCLEEYQAQLPDIIKLQIDASTLTLLDKQIDFAIHPNNFSIIGVGDIPVHIEAIEPTIFTINQHYP